MKQLENQDKVTADSHTDYIKDLFTNNGQAINKDLGDADHRNKKSEILNEYLSDNFMERFSNLLSK